jgi:formate-dependent nitrite reductase membrane component NrfD
VNAFHVFGSLLALWAVTVAFLGVKRENFPSTDRAMKLVGAISVTLVVLAIGSAIYSGIHEKKGDKSKGGDHSALLLPL